MLTKTITLSTLVLTIQPSIGINTSLNHVERREIYTAEFWQKHVSTTWKFVDLHVYLTGHGANVLLEAIRHDSNITAIIGGLGFVTGIPGLSLVFKTFKDSLNLIKATYVGEGLTFRFLGGVIPTGIWSW